MQCQSCGFNNEEDSKFCIRCGTTLTKSIHHKQKAEDVLFVPNKDNSYGVRNTVLTVVVVVIILLLILGIAGSSGSDSTSTADTTSNSSEQPSSSLDADNKVDATLSVVSALDYYYLSTQNDLNDDSQIVDHMTSLLNQNNHLETGTRAISRFTNSSNEIIKLTATGMKEGADIVTEANNELVQFLRSIDPNGASQDSETEYAIANYVAKQKKGYQLIAISAPQVTSLLFKPASSENPSGEIPYTISREDRARILEEIDRLFAENLREYNDSIKNGTNSYNSILFAVEAIQHNLKYDTYEQLN